MPSRNDLIITSKLLKSDLWGQEVRDGKEEKGSLGRVENWDVDWKPGTHTAAQDCWGAV